MTVCTIGFAGKNLKTFVSKIKAAGVGKVIDVRLHNTSQLAGYAKKDDLAYILDLIGIAYEHRPDLAPAEEIMGDYKERRITWEEYEKRFKALLRSRKIKPQNILSGASETICLLCAEDKPDRCHRRLVAEYIQKNIRSAEVNHL